MNNSNEFDYRKAEHDAAVAEYEQKKKEIEERHEEKMKSLQKQKIIRYLVLVPSAVFFVYVIYVRWFRMLAISGLILFIAFICVVDIYKRRSAEKMRLRSQISRVVYNIELRNAYIEDVYKQQLESGEIEHQDNYPRKVKILLASAIVVITLFIIGYSWLTSFNPEHWQTMPWKRKYMYNDLRMQQDSRDKDNHIHKYNFKFMTEDEIIELMNVPEASEYTDKPVIRGTFDVENEYNEEDIRYIIIFAYYNEDESRNVYYYFQRYVDEDNWSLGCVDDPDNFLSGLKSRNISIED
ncbi:MAG: hypothetical protein K5761_01835 [Clostridiales bacterium]|nr:hypothetical protein [Clostridiales bacterium]